jgi:glycoside transferase family 4
MKIAYCIPATSNSGGMERVLSGKANYLASLGHELTIITTDQRGKAPFFPFQEGIAQYDLGINYDENNNEGILSKLRSYPGKKRLHRKRLTALLLELRADVVVSMFGDDADLLPSIQDGSRKVLEYHFSKLKRLQYGRKGLWRLVDLLRTKLDERTVRPYDRFVVLTEEDRSYWGALPNIHVIPNPLPFTTDSPSDCSTHRVIAAGRYDFQKNFELLLHLWAKVAPDFPDWHLDIFGDGKLRGELTALVEKLGLSSSVTLERPTHQMQEVYRTSSVYVMTSRYEGLPMVLLEAQQMGLPIVSFACPCGPRDVITDGVDGFLVEVGDEERFLSSLKKLMADEPMRRRMGGAARHASERYQVDVVMQQWQELFQGLF